MATLGKMFSADERMWQDEFYATLFGEDSTDIWV